MTNDNWPDSRDRLLEDIAKFSEQEVPAVVGTAAPQKSAVAAAKPQHATTAAAAPPPPAAPAAPVAPPPLQMAPSSAMKPEAPPVVTSSLLANLKQQALAKQQSENHKSAQQDEVLQRIHKALGMTYLYLNDLVQQLNILKPPYAKVYSFFGVADFDDLAWQEGRADFRMQETASENKLYDQVTLRYRLAGQKQFQIVKENPALEKLRKALFDYNITFSADEVKNERGHIEKATFTFPCEIKDGLMLSGNYETGNLLLRIRHIERFCLME
ncbi:MAG: hypothetical protein NTY41_04280 [Proteobacteria bacterium]|nr:hypothetical protein [Pseudomonadota bacterium]